MKKLRTRINRFFLRHRDEGIPNLMLYIALGNAIVIIMSMISNNTVLYDLLSFNKTKILQGQVWRLITYVFTQSGSGFFDLIFLYFFYMLGRQIEFSMGTLKFNLFYFSGVLLMDAFAMIFCPLVPEGLVTQAEYYYFVNVFSVYSRMAYYLHLSLILTFATTHPDSQFLILFIIPVRAWLISLIYLVLTFAEVASLAYMGLFPHCLFPLVALGNFFLFTGGDIINVLPESWRAKLRKKPYQKAAPKVIIFENRGPYKSEPQKNYTHKCTICGVTDVDDPTMEFRYCSRCNGYHCYCINHINNHTHIE